MIVMTLGRIGFALVTTRQAFLLALIAAVWSHGSLNAYSQSQTNRNASGAPTAEPVPNLDLDKFIPFGVDPRSIDPANPQPTFQLLPVPPSGSYPDVGLRTEPAYMPDIAKQGAANRRSENFTLPNPNGSPAPPSEISKRDVVVNGQALWKFSFYQAPWESVIRSFAQENGLSLIVNSMPPGVFNYFDQQAYNLQDAIDIFNDHLIPLGHLLIRNQNRLTLISRQNGLGEGVVPFISLRDVHKLGRNEMASIAFPIKSQSQQTILQEMQQLLSSMGTARLLSNSNRLIITDTGSYLIRIRDLLGGSGLAAGESDTIVIPLRNTKAESVATSLNQRSSEMASVRTASTADASGGNGPFSFLQETNCLIVSGTPEELTRYQAIVAEIDRAPYQVVIQGLLVEVNLGNTNELGAEFGLQDSVLFDRSVLDNLVTLSQTSTSPNGVQTTNQNVLSQTAAPGFIFNNSSIGNNVAVSPNTIGSQGLSNLGVGRTNADMGFGGLVLSASSNSVNILLRALAAKYKTEILSRPQIRTVDSSEALIQIGQQVPVVDGVTVTPVGTVNPIIRQDRAGIILRVTPHISPDGLIQIKVEAEKSAFRLAPGSGVPVFSDAKTGTIIQAPIKDLTTAQTTVAARSGQTIVLGGMITTDQNDIERKVPFLGDIPLLGRFFRYDKHTTARKELLIFLTPQVINCDEQSELHKATEMQRVQLNLDKISQIHGSLIDQYPQSSVTPLSELPEGEVMVPEVIVAP